MADRPADMGSPDHRARMSDLRLDLIEAGWTVFHPEPHADRWFVAASNLATDQETGTAQVCAGSTPLEALERIHSGILGTTGLDSR
jgi:hypothetical protein